MRKELVDIDLATMRGLEIGPLAAPVVHKSDGVVFYVDHTDAEGLRRKYADDVGIQGRLDSIVDVDFVMDAGQTLATAVQSQAPFDYVIASHLIEHIPDMVSWLGQIASLMSPGGILSLVIPDKRFTFDVNRSPTDISEVVDAYLRRLTSPSPGQIYDFFSRAINGLVDPVEAWDGSVDYSDLVRTDCEDPHVTALQCCQRALDSDEFVDVHCHVFTPSSFLEVYEKLVRLGLVSFEISHFFPTERPALEFYVSFRLLEPASDRTQVAAAQMASVENARRILQDHEARLAASLRPSGPPTVELGVSDLERRVILLKRDVLLRARSLLKRVRRRS